jgi:rod shape determining protein RodA
MATRALPQSTSRSFFGAEIGAFVRHVDYLLLLAVGGVIAYGLWVLNAVTRNDIPGDPGYYLVRQEVYVAVGAVVLAVVAAINPEVWRRYNRVL